MVEAVPEYALFAIRYATRDAKRRDHFIGAIPMTARPYAPGLGGRGIRCGHFYENLESRRPFTTRFHVGDMVEGFEMLLAAAPTPDHIVPGHDPLAVQRYSAPSEGIAVRIDASSKAIERRSQNSGH